MTDELRGLVKDQTGDIEEIAVKLGRLYLEPASSPSLCFRYRLVLRTGLSFSYLLRMFQFISR